MRLGNENRESMRSGRIIVAEHRRIEGMVRPVKICVASVLNLSRRKPISRVRDSAESSVSAGIQMMNS